MGMCGKIAIKYVDLTNRLDKTVGFSYDSAVHSESIFPREIEHHWYLMRHDEQDSNYVERDNLSKSSSSIYDSYGALAWRQYVGNDR